jgi:hypothetical protein
MKRQRLCAPQVTQIEHHINIDLSEILKGKVLEKNTYTYVCMYVYVGECSRNALKRAKYCYNDDPNKLQLQLRYSSAPKENTNNFSKSQIPFIN